MRSNLTLLFLILFLVISPCVASQNNLFKNERRIYLWDVTLSMKGYNGSPNIYNDVIEAMKNDINSITDEDTEIIVLPFQTNILQVWKVKATPEGKKKLITDITNFKNEDITNTNIYTPLKEVMDKYLTSERRNVLLLLTDGDHNHVQVATKQQLYELLKQWCEFAFKNDAYGFYIMLTKDAAKDNNLIEIIEKTCRLSGVEGININFVELLPTQLIKYNIKDDAGKLIPISIICKKNIEVPAGVKIRVRAEENEYVEINTVEELRNNTIFFDVRFKRPYEALKEELPQDHNYKIRLKLDIEDMNPGLLVSLLSEEIILELINKPEKTLKIYVED